MSRLQAFACFVFAAAFAGALGCSRTPPELMPPGTSGSSSGNTSSAAVTADKPLDVVAATAPAVPASAPSSSSARGRCIAATPPVAPPIPPPASAAACPPDPDGIPKLKIAQVAFPEAPYNPKVEVEIVTTEDQIQRGLMYRRTMAEEHGMLFRLVERTDHTFWMHNTCISLDMLFVDDDGMVVGIVEAATPLADTTRSVGCLSTWVLEVNAGWCRRHGVKAGQKMGIPPAAR